MKKELEDSLFEKYPQILKRENLKYGFSCGDGWFPIIDRACSFVQNHTDWHNAQGEYSVRESPIDGVTIPQFEMRQVKEKFGGLRLYGTGFTDYTRGAIDMAEGMSYRICEVCGSTGSLRKSRWWQTLCDQHNEEREAKNRSQSAPQENEGGE